jgi:hypothetical protein
VAADEALVRHSRLGDGALGRAHVSDHRVGTRALQCRADGRSKRPYRRGDEHHVRIPHRAGDVHRLLVDRAKLEGQ